MMKLNAVFGTVAGIACALATLGSLTVTPASAAWDKPWQNEDKALVIDAYEFNPINWQELSSDKRISAFINKASDGLPPEWNCSDREGDDWKLCKNRWWKYSVTKELYETRREMAKMKGLLWGAYHLARPGNPKAQADHFIDFADPGPNELIALDIEDMSDDWMSLEDAEIFAKRIKARVGRYPVLYTNGNTADYIADHAEDYPLLSRMPIWYARYRDDITGRFPEHNWPQYALWQFSSMHNCNASSCPYRVSGTSDRIDVNVASTDDAGLRKAWPFGELIDRPEPEKPMLLADVTPETADSVAADPTKRGSDAEEASRAVERAEVAVAMLAGDRGGNRSREAGEPVVEGTLAAAYGSGAKRKMLDPLELMNEAAQHPDDGARSQADDDLSTSQKAMGARVDAAKAFTGLSDAEVRQAGRHITALSNEVRRAVGRIGRFLSGGEDGLESESMDGGKSAGAATARSRVAAMIRATAAERSLGTPAGNKAASSTKEGSRDDDGLAKHARLVSAAYRATSTASRIQTSFALTQ